ncbi:NSF attachment protein [Artemisia annua]|uniref:NSF attachment protein n=1 Tax=Artemisia annua TaxID=35608 RepID=A0A2U1N6X7_ARTAN|nr:NSF attachment protein [Artemisia annua]
MDRMSYSEYLLMIVCKQTHLTLLQEKQFKKIWFLDQGEDHCYVTSRMVSEANHLLSSIYDGVSSLKDDCPQKHPATHNHEPDVFGISLHSCTFVAVIRSLCLFMNGVCRPDETALSFFKDANSKSEPADAYNVIVVSAITYTSTGTPSMVPFQENKRKRHSDSCYYDTDLGSVQNDVNQVVTSNKHQMLGGSPLSIHPYANSISKVAGGCTIFRRGTPYMDAAAFLLIWVCNALHSQCKMQTYLSAIVVYLYAHDYKQSEQCAMSLTITHHAVDQHYRNFLQGCKLNKTIFLLACQVKEHLIGSNGSKGVKRQKYISNA